MVKDRLNDLKAAREEMEEAGEVPPPVAPPYVYEQHIDIEEEEEDDPDSLHNFFLKAREVRDAINTTNNHTREMRRLQSVILSSPRPDELAKRELEDRMSAIKTIGNNVRKILKEMTASTARVAARSDGVENANLRMRRTQHTSLSRLFSDTLVSYNESQLEYRERCKERIQRQLLIANKHTTEDELEGMLEAGNVAVFTGDIVVSTREAQQALADIQARHHEIVALERNIRELRDLFLEMSSLIETQGELVDRIENLVSSAAEYIEVAEKETKKAIVYQGKARKKMIIIIVMVTVILICLGIGLYFILKPIFG